VAEKQITGTSLIVKPSPCGESNVNSLTNTVTAGGMTRRDTFHAGRKRKASRRRKEREGFSRPAPFSAPTVLLAIPLFN
jgi:hypothetical protein